MQLDHNLDPSRLRPPLPPAPLSPRVRPPRAPLVWSKHSKTHRAPFLVICLPLLVGYLYPQMESDRCTARTDTNSAIAAGRARRLLFGDVNRIWKIYIFFTILLQCIARNDQEGLFHIYGLLR